MNGQAPISLDYSYLLPEVSPELVASWQPEVDLAHQKLHDKSGQGNDFLGWLDPQAIMDAEQLGRIKATAARLQAETDVMVVIGIGGSYLGARTVIDALALPGGKQVWFAGQTLSAEYTAHLLQQLAGVNFCLNVVSKSGTTTEPAIAFRLLRDLLEKKVGKEKAAQLTVATTDASRGALRTLADQEGYESYVIPDDVGGRYSVLTAVGMLPIAYAGVDVDALLAGAVACAGACQNPKLEKNPAYTYAVVRNILYRQGKLIEMMATFEPRLHFLAEWWKQLYGESEGKDNMGIFPASAEFTTDLHSLGQYIQQGRRELFETFIEIAGGQPEVKIPSDAQNLDGLNFLAGVTVNEVNRNAFLGTALAHREGGVPSMTITLPDLSAYSLGMLLYFFEKACGISGYLLGVNPFNQPGVEAYKQNMFALMGKKGPEEQTKVREAVQGRVGKQVVTF